jgi:hypothetical protein
VFLTLVDLLRRHGWNLNRRIGIVDSLAYLALVLFWARAAWRREPVGASAQPLPEGAIPPDLVAAPAAVVRSRVEGLPGGTEGRA